MLKFSFCLEIDKLKKVAYVLRKQFPKNNRDCKISFDIETQNNTIGIYYASDRQLFLAIKFQLKGECDEPIVFSLPISALKGMLSSPKRKNEEICFQGWEEQSKHFVKVVRQKQHATRKTNFSKDRYKDLPTIEQKGEQYSIQGKDLLLGAKAVDLFRVSDKKDSHSSKVVLNTLQICYHDKGIEISATDTTTLCVSGNIPFEELSKEDLRQSLKIGIHSKAILLLNGFIESDEELKIIRGTIEHQDFPCCGIAISGKNFLAVIPCKETIPSVGFDCNFANYKLEQFLERDSKVALQTTKKELVEGVYYAASLATEARGEITSDRLRLTVENEQGTFVRDISVAADVSTSQTFLVDAKKLLVAARFLEGSSIELLCGPYFVILRGNESRYTFSAVALIDPEGD